MNAKDDKGRTALMWAADKRSSGGGEMLLEKGADIQDKGQVGLTALKRAQNQATRK